MVISLQAKSVEFVNNKNVTEISITYWWNKFDNNILLEYLA